MVRADSPNTTSPSRRARPAATFSTVERLNFQSAGAVRTNKPARSTGSSLESKYVIAREYRGLAPTYTVVFQTRENLSHHETEAEARAAVRRYEEADARRAK